MRIFKEIFKKTVQLDKKKMACSEKTFVTCNIVFLPLFYSIICNESSSPLYVNITLLHELEHTVACTMQLEMDQTFFNHFFAVLE